jgi:hypothetical protein
MPPPDEPEVIEPEVMLPPAAPQARAAAAEFAAQCDRNINSWQRGSAFFPSALNVKMEESRAYVAGIDISGSNDLRDRLPNDISYTEASVDVRCGLGARLESTSPIAQVDETDWIMLEFDATGKLQWTWKITGKKPGSTDLKLELRPAVAVVDGGLVVPAGDTTTPTTVFGTKLQVTATWTQHLYSWWEDNWGKLTGIVAAIGGAAVGVRAWMHKFRGPREATTAPEASSPRNRPTRPTTGRSLPARRRVSSRQGAKPHNSRGT